MTLKFIGAAATLVLVLTQCATKNEEPTTPWLERVHGLTGEMSKTEDLSASSLLKMRAPSLAKSWGAPEMRISKNGSYTLFYKDSKTAFEQLQIYAYPAGIPTPTHAPSESVTVMIDQELGDIAKPQGWKSIALNLDGNRQTVRWFREASGGGADGNYYSTEIFPVTRNGQTTYFRLVIESVSGQAPSRFTEVRLID